MSEWSYNNPVKVRFGDGCLQSLAPVCRGRRVALVTSAGFTRRRVAGPLRVQLGCPDSMFWDSVEPNPTFESIKEAWSRLRSQQPQAIVALGGGSVLDTAKVLAAWLPQKDADWLERVLKNNEPYSRDFEPLPIFAAPTTAGNGSEVTPWATVWDFEEKKKYSLRHTRLFPRYAFVDPMLTHTLPPRETLHSGLDALSHSLEAIWNKNANPVSDCLAQRAAAAVLLNLPVVMREPQNADARQMMCQASLMAGLAFSNTQTALAHSLSYFLTTHYDLPHGLACSLSLPFVARANWNQDPGRDRILAELFPENPEAPFLALKNFLGELGVETSLAAYGVEQDRAAAVLNEALDGERGVNNLAPQKVVMNIFKQEWGNLI
jgi:phosphonate metabolism-associated iron-containing alcohol dehydrogenase